MAKFGSPSIVFLVGGYNFLAAKLKGMSHKFESIMEPDSGLGDAYESSAPVGVTRLTITQSGGFFDTATNSSHDALVTQPTTPAAVARLVCFGAAGNTAGAPCDGVTGLYSHAYEVLGALSGLTKANGEHVIAGTREPGHIIQPLATFTADWNTEASSIDHTAAAQRVIPITSNSIANPTVVTTPIAHGLTTGQVILISDVATSDPTINGQRTATVIDATSFSVPVNVTTGGTGGSFVLASTVSGGAGYLQVTAASGFTNFVGKIRDSADDITYADLVTFADNVVAPFAERVAVAGTVDRYLAFDGNVTGTGSITAFAMFSRA